MSQEVDYDKTTIDRIIDYLADWKEANEFQKIFYGDPGEIPSDEMPCLTVDLLQSDVEQAATGMDRVIERILVKVVINTRTYMTDYNNETVSWKKKLELLVQGKDAATGQYDPTTLLGVLRKQLTLGSYTIQNKVSTRFGEVPRGEEGDDETTGEAHATFTVEHLVQTPGKV